MKCIILHESRRRMRIHAACRRMTLEEADILEFYLRSKPFVTDVKIYDRTCDAVIFYSGTRDEVIKALAQFSFKDNAAKELVPPHTSRALNREFEDKLSNTVIWHLFKRFFTACADKIRYRGDKVGKICA